MDWLGRLGGGVPEKAGAGAREAPAPAPVERAAPGLAAFFDGGAASGGFAGLDSFGFRTSTGAGVRLTTRDKVLLRFDVATGDEGTRFNARIGYSF